MTSLPPERPVLSLFRRSLQVDGWALIKVSEARFYCVGLWASFAHPELFIEGVGELDARRMMAYVASCAAALEPLSEGVHQQDGRHFSLGFIPGQQVRTLMPLVPALYGAERPAMRIEMEAPKIDRFEVGRFFPWIRPFDRWSGSLQ